MVCSGGGGLFRGVCSWRVPGGDPPGTTTAAGGTHPTGMHSCGNKFFLHVQVLYIFVWRLINKLSSVVPVRIEHSMSLLVNNPCHNLIIACVKM